ncbi:MAG: hypothetical protein IT529_04940 [Burkholderiales bacterium]|nr:hypothetical protein [Burkholderiales bacterium]
MRIAAMLCSLVAAGPIVAAPPAPAGPQPGEVEVIAGGIGEDEQRAILAREKEFNLKLVLSLTQGNYVADADVVVSDARGVKVVERGATGPLVLVRLPAGEYSVSATRGGRTLTRRVKLVTGKLRTEYLRWPADPKEDLPVSRWLERE